MATKSPSPSSYLKPGRLADVITLIQILAFDPSSRRSSDGLNRELSRAPLSAETWAELARLHPEFFRILERKEGQRESISLVARFVLPAVPSPTGGDPKSPALSPDVTSTLMNLAVQLHDREIQRRDRWKTVLVPTIVAIIAAAAAITAAVISTSKARDLGPGVQTPPTISAPSTPGQR
jgi:hypothetical protein